MSNDLCRQDFISSDLHHPTLPLSCWLKPKVSFGSELVLAINPSYIKLITGTITILVLVLKVSAVIGQPFWAASGYRGSCHDAPLHRQEPLCYFLVLKPCAVVHRPPSAGSTQWQPSSVCRTACSMWGRSCGSCSPSWASSSSLCTPLPPEACASAANRATAACSTTWQQTHATAATLLSNQVSMARHNACQETQATIVSWPFKQSVVHHICTAASPGWQGMPEAWAGERGLCCTLGRQPGMLGLAPETSTRSCMQ